MTTIPFPYGIGNIPSNYAISDDGDIIALGGVLYRISDDTFPTIRCPDGTPPTQRATVRFAGDASVVYFLATGCGRSQFSLYRHDLATATTTLVHPDNCFFNSGNICVEDVVPTVDDAHLAILKLFNNPAISFPYTVLLDGQQCQA